MSRIFLSVIIPTYNNKKDILMTLMDIYRHLESQKYNSEIIAIDDGSSDGTVEMISRYIPLIKNLKFINNQSKQGKDFVIKQAALLAKGDWRVILSPEDHISVIEFNKVIPYTKKGYEIFLDGNRQFQCFSAQAAEEIFPHLKSNSNWRIARLANILGYQIKEFAFRRPL